MDIETAVIPVAGKGTRFLPITKQIPKEMLPLLDKPVIQYIVEELVATGIREIIFVTSLGKELLTNYFDRNRELESFLRANNKDEKARMIEDIGRMVDVCTVRQKEQLGLGHALLCAQHIVGERDFVVVLGDEIILSPGKTAVGQLMDAHQSISGASGMIGAVEVSGDQTQHYGIIDGRDVGDGKTFYLDKMVEKPSPAKAPSTLASPGRYLFTPEIFRCLKKIGRGQGGEYQLTDAINLLAKGDALFAHLLEGERYDVGTPLGHLKATIDFALKRGDTGDELRAFLREVSGR